MTRGRSQGLARLSTAAALLLSACADPGLQPPTRTLTDPATLGASAAPEVTPWPAERWWQGFGDPALSALVEQALARQPSLQQAQARVAQAQARVSGARAGAGPQAGLSADLTHQRFTEHGRIPPALAGAMRWSADVQLSGNWELDLFGRQRALIDAAIGQQRAAEADAQAARVWLAAQVATHWFALARQLEAQRLAEQALRQRQQLLAVVQQRQAAGLDNALDRQQAESLLAQARVERDALDDGIARERHALAELTGQGPQAQAEAQPALAPLRTQALPGTLGADLLGRRADLVAQRWRVEAALRGVDGARAQFYPDVNLMAFVGLSSLGLDTLINAGSRTFGAGPALRLPLFDGGRLRAQLASRSADADAAIEGWNSSLLAALREVADEVATLQALVRQQATQAEATAAAEATHALALQRHRAGLGTVLPVLLADHALLAQRRAQSDLKARHLAAEVALARALGGGYQAAELPPAPTASLTAPPNPTTRP